MRSLRFGGFFVLFFVSVMLGQSQSDPSPNQGTISAITSNFSYGANPSVEERILENYGKLPLAFEPNQGQVGSKVNFLSRGNGYMLFLTANKAIFSLRESESQLKSSGTGTKLAPTYAASKPAVLQMRLVNANPVAKVTGECELPGKSNYFIGNNPKKWHSDIPTFGKVKYEGVYAGIDLVYYGNQRQLEYDFVVAPKIDPHKIQLEIRGVRNVKQVGDGTLLLQVGKTEIRWGRPIVYQEKDGKKQEIAARYLVKRKNRIGFEIANYDSRRPLFIDPVVYSTYLGGSGNDSGSGIVVDSSGNAYITGTTYSTDFPTTQGAFQTVCNGGSNCNQSGDAFVTKLNSTGTALIYSTYLGGSQNDSGLGITIDSIGDAYIVGTTGSTNFPTTPGAFQTTCKGGCVAGTDAFVAEINPSGSALVYSTYFGGSAADNGSGIAVDGSGNAYVTGATYSTDFPTTPGAFQTTCGGGSCNLTDGFVAEINASGSGLVYSTYLGGSSIDNGSGIAVDQLGNAYVTGMTYSVDFPTMNAFQASNAGGSDAFVTKLNPQGSDLVYSTYLGGSGYDGGNAIAVDSTGNAYLTGWAGSYNFPTMNPAQPNFAGGSEDTFVTEINQAGSSLVYSTYLGGTGDDAGSSIALDGSGYAYVTGSTGSFDFPVANPSQRVYGGNPSDAFISIFNPSGSALAYSSYLGGSAGDSGAGISVDGASNAYVVGYSASTNFPTTPGALQRNCGGYGCPDAFVTMISPSPFVTLSPHNLNFGNQAVGTTSDPQNITLASAGNASLTISSIVTTGDFSQTNNCPVGGILPAGSNCTIAVSFTPTVNGSRYGTLLVGDNAPGSPQTVPLSGVGIGPFVTLSPPNLSFGNQTVDTTSSPQFSTLINTGNAALTITSIGSNDNEFTETNDCGPSIPVGGGCTITVTFTPSQTGTRNGAIKIVDNAPDSPQSLKLTGVGVLPVVSFSPTNLTFPTQLIYTTSPAQQVTLSNTGLGILIITGGGFSGPFGGSTTCGKTVPPGGSCTINVVFKPKAKGQLSGSVTVKDNAADSPQSVPLSGIGTYVQLSPKGLNFGTQPVDTTSPPKNITLSNKGSGPVNITNLSITGTNAGDFAQQNNCGKSVPRGGYCTIRVTFTPTAQGKRTAAVSISDDGGGSPQTAPLSGTGTP